MSKTESNSLGIKVNLQSNQAHLSESDIFGILQNDRRRNILKILREQGSQSIRSLSEEIARLESETDEPESSLRRSTYISLFQTHIPKMEKMGIITYDREQDKVELLPIAHNFDVYMETVEKGNIPWSQFYLGLSIIALAGSIIIQIGLFEWITIFEWVLFTNTLFLFSSTANMYRIRKFDE